MRLDDLPDDILVLSFSQCDIDTLFAIRLACRSLRAVTDAYIKTIAPNVARNTFPSASPFVQTPCEGPSLHWLRGLIPAYLAAVTLDKDKLRRFPYINSGYPYGIPYESEDPKAIYWRRRLANGWKVMRSFHLISRDVYAPGGQALYERAKLIKRVSSGMRTSRMWQAVSCPYQACTEHGMKHIFDSKSGQSGWSDSVEEVRRKESLVLKKRLASLRALTQDELLDYTYLWRLFLWTFRPYRKPATSLPDCIDGKSQVASDVRWQAEISSISQGCSWLMWFLLHFGTTPFWRQWKPDDAVNSGQANSVRDLIWKERSSRSHHQIELEREYMARFEFALRRRCLSRGQNARLDLEIREGRVVKTVSLECIPWDYDQAPIISKPACDFPWYSGRKLVWLARDVWMMLGEGTIQAPPATSPNSADGEENEEVGGFGDETRGALVDVPYLVYLGLKDAQDMDDESEWFHDGVGMHF
ncbi:hypothetical protein EJ04DRAFT_575448 [Polyplosphaeria fusca]|uniref:F-box domain-containing protein n=1 Tax=Polyplosphaeria fusca TaxID=682080 RepID=A0A9P4QYN2_9PLEO|nr:hypothetical protein EJ04DRAFT_575448 [Polyplosphaeria fusca]